MRTGGDRPRRDGRARRAGTRVVERVGSFRRGASVRAHAFGSCCPKSTRSSCCPARIRDSRPTRPSRTSSERGRGRTIHFHWLENGSAFPLPGQPLPARHEIERVYQRALLETDYEALADRQRAFVSAMRGATIHVTDPRGTDLRFRIGDRPVNVQDGDASKARTDDGVILIDREIELPAGAIRVAPIEDSVEGTIAFPTSRWGGRGRPGARARDRAGGR